MDNRKYWIWLSLVCGQGSSLAVRLIHGRSIEEVYGLDVNVWSELSGKTIKDVRSIIGSYSLNEAERIVEWCDGYGVNIITPDMDEYPKSLKLLADYPMVIYALGNRQNLNNLFICAVVGTRSVSDYGKRSAYDIGAGLASGGAVVASGLALGADGIAMRGALDNNGVCVGVLGCGIDVVYPRDNAQLMKDVMKNGVIITEYPPGSPPKGRHFPVRNRIISGISTATVVIEASKISGAIITAKHALYQGKELYAVPGEIYNDTNAGNLRLLKEGARTITNAWDILKNYEFMFPHQINISNIRAAYEGMEGRKKKVREVDFDLIAGSSRGIYGEGISGGRKKSYDRQKSRTVRKRAGKEPEAETKNIETSGGMAAKEKKETAYKKVDFNILGENEWKIYNAMTADIPTLPDDLTDTGLMISDIMASLTMLEISGAVEAGAGGYFLKRSADSDLPEESDGE